MKPTESTTKSRVEKPLKNKVLRTEDAHVGHARRPGTPSIELFQHESCPSSHAVRNGLSALGLDYVAHVVTPDAPLARQKLIRSGGKDQIPFMIDHRTGIKLYESQAILKYLDHEYGPKFENAIERLVHEVDQRTRTELEQLKWRLKIPAERLREYRATLREGVDTLRGTAKLIREAFRQALAYPGDVDTAGATVGERVAAAKRAA